MQNSMGQLQNGRILSQRLLRYMQIFISSSHGLTVCTDRGM